MRMFWIAIVMTALLAGCSHGRFGTKEDKTLQADSVAARDLDAAESMYQVLKRQASTLHESQQTELLRLRFKVRRRQAIDGESGVPALASYFASHGTEEEQLVAQYLLASFYLDAEEVENSYQVLSGIVSHGYPTGTHRARDVMRRVYSALQYICVRDANHADALKWGKTALQSHVYDTEEQYRIHYDIGNSYYVVGEKDSCLRHMQCALKILQTEARWDDNMVSCVSDMLGYSVLSGNKDMADTCYQLLSSHSSRGTISTLDYNVASYWLVAGRRDSAQVRYRKAVSTGTSASRYAACRQLAQLFRLSGQVDSACHYQDKALEIYDTLYVEQEKAVTKRLNGLYQRQKQEEEIARGREQRLWMMLLTALVAAVASIGWLVVLTLRRKLLREREERCHVVQERKILEQELGKLTERLSMQASKPLDDTEESASEAKALERLNRKWSEGKLGTEADFAVLLEAYSKSHPNFLPSIHQRYPRIKNIDIIICLLVLYGFSGKKIGLLMGYERQEIYHFVQRMMKYLVGQSNGRIESLRSVLLQIAENDDRA